jgi:REP element-mobilizing transposase RayT
VALASRSSSNVVDAAKHHLIWCPNCRRRVLLDVDARLQEIIREIGEEKGIELPWLEVLSDHVQLMIEGHPSLALPEAIESGKARSSRVVFEELPRLEGLPSLSTSSWSCSTVGGAALEVLRRYVETREQAAEMAHRYRLVPESDAEAVLRRHCGDARLVWNLALEQAKLDRSDRSATPSAATRSRQLAEARQGTWLGTGSSSVQQQALRDFIEQFTPGLVRDYDLIVLEDLEVASMVRSAGGTVEATGTDVAAKRGLNRSIQSQARGLLRQRLADTAAAAAALVNVVIIKPALTSQHCAVYGHMAKENRKSQAVFARVACGHGDHADPNAATTILAAGLAVTGRGGTSHGEAKPVLAKRPDESSSTRELVSV